MNKFNLFIFLVLSFIYSCSDSSPLEPLPEFYLIETAAENNDTTDKKYKLWMESIAFRCASLTQAIISEEITPKIEKEILTKEFFSKYKEISSTFLVNRYSSARNIELLTEESVLPNMNIIKTEISPIKKEYLRLMRKNYSKYDNYFDNKIIRNDLNVCGPLYKEMGTYKDSYKLNEKK